MTDASHFISTRGQAPRANFAEVLLAGLAPDGGLYVPAAWPHLSESQISGFAGARYQDVAFEILSRFAGNAFAAAERLPCRASARKYLRSSQSSIRPLVSAFAFQGARS